MVAELEVRVTYGQEELGRLLDRLLLRHIFGKNVVLVATRD